MASRWIQFKLFNYLSQENNTAKDERKKKHFPQKSVGILGFIYQSKKKRNPIKTAKYSAYYHNYRSWLNVSYSPYTNDKHF